MLYLILFWTFFKIGLFGFGGGAAILSLIQFEVVQHYDWMTAGEFTNIVAISQVTPGPIGINCATYTGYVATGSVFGAFVATMALVLPSFIIMLAIVAMVEKFRNNPYVEGVMKALRPVVVGLIAAAALLLITEDSFGEGYTNWISWLIFAGALSLIQFAKMNPIIVLLITAILGIIIY